MMGRRPKRSDSAPSTGEQRNCISAQTVPNTPNISAARAVSLPRNPATSLGSTGTIMPSARTSSTTVTKMKTSALRRGGGAAVESVDLIARGPVNGVIVALVKQEGNARSANHGADCRRKNRLPFVISGWQQPLAAADGRVGIQRPGRRAGGDWW